MGLGEAVAELRGRLIVPVLLLWCALHFVLAAAGTWLARKYALHRQLLDQPGERRSHRVATPRGGGIAIVIALLVGCGAASWLWPGQRFYTLGFAGALLLVALVGWWDDHRPLSARLRLFVHCLASLWLGWMVFRFTGNGWDGVFAALASVVLINVWNFMDGINGLAVSQAALAAAGYALILPGALDWAGWSLVAACLGFLPFNFPRARIFLGDGGSGALGFALASLLALAVVTSNTSWWSCWIPLTAFLVDAGFTLLARMLARQRWWEPHAQHVYQALARVWKSHAVVTGIYLGFSVIAVFLFLYLRALQPGEEAVGSVVWLLLASVVWLLLRKGLQEKDRFS